MGIFKAIKMKTFDDICGMEEIKERLEKKVIEPFCHPTVYDGLIPKNKNILLYGPPGCGKTMLAYAIAGELEKETGKKVYLNKDATMDISDIYAGQFEERVAKMFNDAVKNSPSVVYFEDIHAFRCDENLSSILINLKKIKDKDVIIIADTNKPWVLDAVYLHSNIFDDNVFFVPPPDCKTREQIFEANTKRIKELEMLSPDVNFGELAKKTRGYAASDLVHVCNYIAIDIAKERSKKIGKIVPVSQCDFLDAINENGLSLNLWYKEAHSKLKHYDVLGLNDFITDYYSGKWDRNARNCIGQA